MADAPLNPQWTPPQGPVPPQDPAARARRQRLGMIGAGVGFGVYLLAIAAVLAYVQLTITTTSEAELGRVLLLLGAEVILSPITIITGIVLTAVRRTRPFGVGFLIGTAVGIIVAAGVCFGQTFFPTQV